MLGLGLGPGFKGAGGLPAFSPSQIAGQILWLRADLGASVSTWVDQSPVAGTGATQATGASQPTLVATNAAYNGKPTFHFGGSSFMAVAAGFAPSQPYTTLIVCDVTTTGTQYIVDGGSIATGALRMNNAVFDIFAGAQLQSVNNTVNTAQAFALTYNGAASKIYINASASPVTGSAGSSAISGFTIGAAGNHAANMTGDIAEIIMYSRALLTAEVAQLFAYFSTRYGTASS